MRKFSKRTTKSVSRNRIGLAAMAAGICLLTLSSACGGTSLPSVVSAPDGVTKGSPFCVNFLAAENAGKGNVPKSSTTLEGSKLAKANPKQSTAYLQMNTMLTQMSSSLNSLSPSADPQLIPYVKQIKIAVNQAQRDLHNDAADPTLPKILNDDLQPAQNAIAVLGSYAQHHC